MTNETAFEELTQTNQELKRMWLLDQMQADFFQALNKPRIGYTDCKAMSEAREVYKQNVQQAFHMLRNIRKRKTVGSVAGLRAHRDEIEVINYASDVYTSYKMAHRAYVRLYKRYMLQIAQDAKSAARGEPVMGLTISFRDWILDVPANDE